MIIETPHDVVSHAIAMAAGFVFAAVNVKIGLKLFSYVTTRHLRRKMHQCALSGGRSADLERIGDHWLRWCDPAGYIVAQVSGLAGFEITYQALMGSTIILTTAFMGGWVIAMGVGFAFDGLREKHFKKTWIGVGMAIGAGIVTADHFWRLIP